MKGISHINKVTLFNLILICFCWLSSPDISASVNIPMPISGHNPKNIKEIIPADVLARVRLVQKELNYIRLALGKRKSRSIFIKIDNASPREVYFEAQSLYRKANRLSFEVAQQSSEIPAIPDRDIYPGDVLGLVNKVLKKIYLVKKTLNITQTAQEEMAPKATSPSEVFNAILESNQQLNKLLYHRFTPSDVYGEVTLSVYYTQDLLKHFNVVNRISNSPKFIPNKRPQDVYEYLIQCMDILQRIAKKYKISILNINLNKHSLNKINPSDVYDLSKIIVSELDYLYRILLKNSAGYLSYYPGYKTPSHVFEKVGLLHKQLELMASSANTTKQKVSIS